jgi:phytoene desaturase
MTQPTFTEKRAHKPQSVVVIGAGIAGISAAIHLARTGLQVTIIERNNNPGGRCDRFISNGHYFDSGPTLYVMPHVYEDEFRSMGSDVHEMLDLQRVDPTYHLVFDDGSRLALTSDLKSMEEQLEHMEPGAFRGFLHYMDEGSRHYHEAMKLLVNRDFRKASEFINLKNMPLAWKIKPLQKHYDHMGAFFKQPRLKSAFSFQDVYMGLSPFEAPATFSMMPYTEMAHGVFYPRGGMYRVVEALVELAEQAGVEFIYNTDVKQINIEGRYAKGVILEDGSLFEASAVLANADLPYVYQNLLPQDGEARKLEHKRYSCSVISFFWALDRCYDSLPPHTLFLADDYRRNFDQIIRDLDIPDDPSIYIHAPVRLNPQAAPPGDDTVIAIVPCGHINARDDQDWKAGIEKARQSVFERLKRIGITDLQEHIKTESVYTPPSWRVHYNLVNGSTHGLCHNLFQLGYFRPHNRHARYHNMYFTGASTHPGTGMPTALISGRLSSRRILDDFGIA